MNIIDQVTGAWKAFCRPPRQNYSIFDLGSPVFQIKGIRCKRHDFKVQNSRSHLLECSFYEPLGVTPIDCVIYLHCFNGSRIESVKYAEPVVSKGCAFCSFDFSGSGLSQGDYVSLGYYEQDDVAAVVQHLRANMGVRAIGLWGRSMGAVTALLYTQKFPSEVHGLAIDSAFVSMYDAALEIADKKIHLPTFLIKGMLEYVRSKIKTNAGYDMDDVNTLTKITRCTMPVLFIVSKDDKLVPHTNSLKLFEKYPESARKSILYVKGNHNECRDWENILAIIDFLVNSIKAGFPGETSIPQGQQYEQQQYQVQQQPIQRQQQYLQKQLFQCPQNQYDARNINKPSFQQEDMKNNNMQQQQQMNRNNNSNKNISYNQQHGNKSQERQNNIGLEGNNNNNSSNTLASNYQLRRHSPTQHPQTVFQFGRNEPNTTTENQQKDQKSYQILSKRPSHAQSFSYATAEGKQQLGYQAEQQPNSIDDNKGFEDNPLVQSLLKDLIQKQYSSIHDNNQASTSNNNIQNQFNNNTTSDPSQQQKQHMEYQPYQQQLFQNQQQLDNLKINSQYQQQQEQQLLQQQQQQQQQFFEKQSNQYQNLNQAKNNENNQDKSNHQANLFAEQQQFVLNHGVTGLQQSLQIHVTSNAEQQHLKQIYESQHNQQQLQNHMLSGHIESSQDMITSSIPDEKHELDFPRPKDFRTKQQINLINSNMHRANVAAHHHTSFQGQLPSSYHNSNNHNFSGSPSLKASPSFKPEQRVQTETIQDFDPELHNVINHNEILRQLSNNNINNYGSIGQPSMIGMDLAPSTNIIMQNHGRVPPNNITLQTSPRNDGGFKANAPQGQVINLEEQKTQYQAAPILASFSQRNDNGQVKLDSNKELDLQKQSEQQQLQSAGPSIIGIDNKTNVLEQEKKEIASQNDDDEIADYSETRAPSNSNNNNNHNSNNNNATFYDDEDFHNLPQNTMTVNLKQKKQLADNSSSSSVLSINEPQPYPSLIDCSNKLPRKSTVDSINLITQSPQSTQQNYQTIQAKSISFPMLQTEVLPKFGSVIGQAQAQADDNQNNNQELKLRLLEQPQQLPEYSQQNDPVDRLRTKSDLSPTLPQQQQQQSNQQIFQQKNCFDRSKMEMNIEKPFRQPDLECLNKSPKNGIISNVLDKYQQIKSFQQRQQQQKIQQQDRQNTDNDDTEDSQLEKNAYFVSTAKTSVLNTTKQTVPNIIGQKDSVNIQVALDKIKNKRDNSSTSNNSNNNNSCLSNSKSKSTIQAAAANTNSTGGSHMNISISSNTNSNLNTTMNSSKLGRVGEDNLKKLLQQQVQQNLSSLKKQLDTASTDKESRSGSSSNVIVVTPVAGSQNKGTFNQTNDNSNNTSGNVSSEQNLRQSRTTSSHVQSSSNLGFEFNSTGGCVPERDTSVPLVSRNNISATAHTQTVLKQQVNKLNYHSNNSKNNRCQTSSNLVNNNNNNNNNSSQEVLGFARTKYDNGSFSSNQNSSSSRKTSATDNVAGNVKQNPVYNDPHPVKQFLIPSQAATEQTHLPEYRPEKIQEMPLRYNRNMINTSNYNADPTNTSGTVPSYSIRTYSPSPLFHIKHKILQKNIPQVQLLQQQQQQQPKNSEQKTNGQLPDSKETQLERIVNQGNGSAKKGIESIKSNIRNSSEASHSSPFFGQITGSEITDENSYLKAQRGNYMMGSQDNRNSRGLSNQNGSFIRNQNLSLERQNNNIISNTTTTTSGNNNNSNNISSSVSTSQKFAFKNRVHLATKVVQIQLGDNGSAMNNYESANQSAVAQIQQLQMRQSRSPLSRLNPKE